MGEEKNKSFQLSCPAPLSGHATIQLAHGSGGKLTGELIQSLFLKYFDNELLRPLEDQARLTLAGTRLAFTTDSYVVDPIFFPGGDIGELAVNGTINDLCMCGARPLYLSAGLIIEEGLAVSDLERIIHSMSRAAANSNVVIVTGDTKVVDRGKADRIFINTAGIGLIEHDYCFSAAGLRAGDKILVSGNIASHGIAIIAQREDLGLQTPIASDTASLLPLVNSLVTTYGAGIHAMRDATRGGIAAILNEFAASSQVAIRISEAAIPIAPPVAAACELLGFDPLHVANEGVMVVAVSPEFADTALEQMRRHPLGENASLLASVESCDRAVVTLRTRFGTERFVDLPVGEQLPRIC